jgi:D-glycero-D-manno-heptose 1,7-bisphosphate phosphatase
MAPIDLSPFALVVFDADNTLRTTLVPGQPCPRQPGEWTLLPGVAGVLASYDWTARRFAIASNQDQVGYSLISEPMARRLLADMARGAIGDAAARALIRLCPHVEADGCQCRKPRPGMLLDLCAEAMVPPSQTLFVGDAATDEECAQRAGTHFMWADTFFQR